MSQTPKRPGTRDISELKARLGLKKAAPEAGKAPAAKASGGVAPPPGLQVPKQSGPVIPAASDDPFGNMNALAQQGTMQRAPEIVIVHDGKPVESVSTGTRAATIAKWAAIALVPLIIGWQLGAIGKSASVYNDGIEGAGQIQQNVKTVNRQLTQLSNDLASAIKKSSGKYDPGVTKVLSQALALSTLKEDEAGNGEEIPTPTNSSTIFTAKSHILNPDLSGRVMVFYSHVAQLSHMISEHVRAAKADDAMAALAAQAEENGSTTVNGVKITKYVVVLNNPGEKDPKAGTPPGAQLVEIGQLCPDHSAPKEGGQCAGGPPGFYFRTEPSGSKDDGGALVQWEKGDLAQPKAGDPFPNASIIPLVPTGVLDTLVKGANPSASALLYQRRLKDISDMIETVKKEAEALDRTLNKWATEPKHFSFFL